GQQPERRVREARNVRVVAADLAVLAPERVAHACAPYGLRRSDDAFGRGRLVRDRDVAATARAAQRTHERANGLVVTAQGGVDRVDAARADGCVLEDGWERMLDGIAEQEEQPRRSSRAGLHQGERIGSSLSSRPVTAARICSNASRYPSVSP